jgi:hypothetical protein
VDTRWIVAGLVAVVMLWDLPCSAQGTEGVLIPENVPPNSPISIGPILLTPTFELKDIGVDTNVFNNDAEVSDFTATPSVQMVSAMLFGPMRFNGLLNTEYIWYQQFNSERSINNSFVLGLEGFFDRLHPWVNGSFVRTRAREGFEIDARAQRTLPTISAGLDWVVGSRTALALSSELARSEYAVFEEFGGANLSEQLNNSTQSFTGGLKFDLTPLTMLRVDADYSTASFAGNSVRDNDAWSIEPSLTFQPDAYISGRMMVGFKTLTPRSPELEDFVGFVAQGEVTMAFFDATQLAVIVERNTEYSFEPLHPYYVQAGFNLSLTQQIGGPFDVRVSGGRYDLTYRDLPDPDNGPRGTERRTTAGLGVGYRIGETIRMGIDGQIEQRRSIERPDRDYDRLFYYGSITYLL